MRPTPRRPRGAGSWSAPTPRSAPGTTTSPIGAPERPGSCTSCIRGRAAWTTRRSGTARWRASARRTTATSLVPISHHADASHRPSNAEYGKYLYLAARYRDHDCDDRDEGYPFVLEDPAVNALFIRSEWAMARIAELRGRGCRAAPPAGARPDGVAGVAVGRRARLLRRPRRGRGAIRALPHRVGPRARCSSPICLAPPGCSRRCTRRTSDSGRPRSCRATI